jgi:hypothetical protein
LLVDARSRRGRIVEASSRRVVTAIGLGERSRRGLGSWSGRGQGEDKWSSRCRSRRGEWSRRVVTASTPRLNPPDTHTGGVDVHPNPRRPPTPPTRRLSSAGRLGGEKKGEPRGVALGLPLGIKSCVCLGMRDFACASEMAWTRARSDRPKDMPPQREWLCSGRI